MHLLNVVSRSLDELDAAVDLNQSPADILFLSFSDSDLSAVASLYAVGDPDLGAARLAPLGQLRHPYSVDLYGEKTAQKARFILVRLLGGLDYWRYGAEELSQMARLSGIALALVPGDGYADPRLADLSTVPADDLANLWGAFQEGGEANLRAAFRWIARRVQGETEPLPPPAAVPSFGRFEAACHPTTDDAPRACLVFYRSHYAAGDTAPIRALAAALAARGLAVESHFVASLKEPKAAEYIRALCADRNPTVVLNATAFSSPLDSAGAPVFQVILATGSREAWAESNSGLSATDLAMNVVLPEIDGRIGTTAIAFKTLANNDPGLEFTPVVQLPDPDQIASVADLATAWARLARKPRGQRRIACILSNYPGKGGREAYAVGLDTPASLLAIADALRDGGYAIPPLPDSAALMARLTAAANEVGLAPEVYSRLFEALPAAFTEAVVAAWGPPPQTAFRFQTVRAGALLIALQPDRGRRETRKQSYHDGAEPPSHAYIAFYLWLRHSVEVDALLHLGTHGTLEWLPGKAAALSPACGPQAVLGPMPVIYPFIVNNPGEAAQAKRRTAAVTLGHLTPPLTTAGSTAALRDIEALMDEYAAALSLDPRRAALLAEAILANAHTSGLAEECGLDRSCDPQTALAQLDNYLCDIKEMRINDGLHIFGRAPDVTVWEASLPTTALPALADCGTSEMAALMEALDGRFIPPGPAGAPSRGRVDVFPTGRNLYTIDPRQVPTRTAWVLGQRAADGLVARYLQDHGDWPQRILLDLWGSATMRTGGEDLAQAIALLGVAPVWDEGSARLSGFTLLPHAVLNRPRIDVTLRISGLFRDVFPQQIALFNQIVAAVAELDEADALNPLAAQHRTAPNEPISRIFGAAPGAYGTGVMRALLGDDGADRLGLGQQYLVGTGYAYDADAARPSTGFAAQVRTADAYVHTQDMAGQDVLDSDAFADHEGGFAAANSALGGHAALYHLDSSAPERLKLRTLAEEVARVVRGRLTNPRWLAGQMRHGHRGAAEIAESVDNLYAFAMLADCVRPHQFELAFEAIIANAEVRAFLLAANPAAATALAGRFALANARGFWTPRRNSARDFLAEMGA